MIDIKHLTKTYRTNGDEIAANREISLHIDEGEFTVISGPSGSGKTTLLNLIGALDTPTSGQIRVAGVELGALSPSKIAEFRRDRIGFVFQRANLVSSLSVLENVLLQRRLQRTLRRSTRDHALELLEQVGLAARASALPGQLSGGQQQRVAIVRAVVAEPAVVVADEPTASLDGENAQEVLALFRTVNADLGITIVASSHDQRVIAAGRREIHLVDGALDHDVPVNDHAGVP